MRVVRQRNTWSWILSAAVALTVLAMVVLTTGPGRACNTPVYRYAMYNWSQSDYYVFHFREGELSPAEQEVNQSLTDLGDSWPTTINVGLELVDALDEEKMEYYPENVLESWAARDEGVTSKYLVYSTRGVELFDGELDKAAIDAMIDSPARQKLCGLLGEGNASVLVFLPGPDAEENVRVQKVLDDVLAQVAEGKLPGTAEDPAFSQVLPAESTDDAATDDNGDPAPADLLGETAEQEEAPLTLAQMKLDRSDESEEWFVRSLMAIESDLYEFVDKPMVFAAYGRGRAMEPYIGDGITVENLIDCVMFLSGPCSCMVKDQNPGVDLLVKWDWEATADTMAEDDWTLDPSGPLAYQEFSPEEMGNPDPVAEEAVEETVEPAEPVMSEETSPETTDTSDPSETPDPPEGEDTPQEEPVVEEVSPAEAEAEAASDESTSEAAPAAEEAVSSGLSGQMWGIGLVLGAVLLVLVVGTVVVVMKQG